MNNENIQKLKKIINKKPLPILIPEERPGEIDVSYFIYYGNFKNGNRVRTEASFLLDALAEYDKIEINDDIHFVDLMKENNEGMRLLRQKKK